MARFGRDTRYPNEYDIVSPSQDIINPAQSMMGGDAFSQSVIEDMLMGRGDQYSPEGLQAPPMFPEEQPGPQDFIRQQLAGDVVPMYGAGSVPASVVQDRLSAPGAYEGSQGVSSINKMHTFSSPYLDLLNILMYPSGRSAAAPIRRR
jgi:hypothetical protein